MTQPAPPDRERIAQADIARTAIAPGLTAVLIAALLVPVLAVTAIQVASGDSTEAARAIPGGAALAAAVREYGFLGANRLLTSELHRFEADLEETSPVLVGAQPAAQWVTTALLATGNTQVVVGRDGWLFFVPDIETLTGPPFPTAPGADLAAFAALRSHGVQLLLVVVPPKPSIHPEKLAPALKGKAPLANASWPALAEALRESGIEVLDPGSLLAEASSVAEPAVPQYLVTDTHWTPAAMELVAAATARAIRPHLSRPAAAVSSRQPATAQNTGDLVRILRVPRGRDLYAPETVTLARVVDRAGAAWAADPEAEVLLLGDSYTLQYSEASMGWGTSAGFAEQIAFELQQPVDRIAVKAGGALQRLVAELAQGSPRLAGKRVVVYQIAARQLTEPVQTSQR